MIFTNILLARFWTGATPVPAAVDTFSGALPFGLYAMLTGFGSDGVTTRYFNPFIASVGNMMRR